MPRKILFIFLGIFICSCGREKLSDTKVIYGSDDRVEIPSSGVWSVLANSVGVQVSTFELEQNDESTYVVKTAINLEQTGHFCGEERFPGQKVVGNGSGFLYSDQQTWVTANHVLTPESCENAVFILGYSLINQGKTWWLNNESEVVIKKEFVYFCEEVVYQKTSADQDVAVARIDRLVPETVAVALQSAARDSHPEISVSMIGHPKNVPAKLVLSATVRQDIVGSFMRADLDAYSGNSGSPVFAGTGPGIIGILKGGTPDYTVRIGPDGEQICRESRVCHGSDCGGEMVSRLPEM